MLVELIFGQMPEACFAAECNILDHNSLTILLQPYSGCIFLTARVLISPLEEVYLLGTGSTDYHLFLSSRKW